MKTKAGIALLAVVYLTHTQSLARQKTTSDDLTQTSEPTAAHNDRQKNDDMPRKQSSAALKPKATIRIKNGITDSMISYKRFGTSHKPTFTVRINGQTVPRGQAVQVPSNETIEVAYDFNFYDIHKGTRKESLKPNPKATLMEMTFSWHDKERVKLTESPSQN